MLPSKRSVPPSKCTGTLVEGVERAPSVSEDDYSSSSRGSSDHDTDEWQTDESSSGDGDVVDDETAPPLTCLLLVNTYEQLATKLSEIQALEQPVVYLAHDQGTVVLLDYSDTGCMFQIPRSGTVQHDDDRCPSELWTLLWDFFQDTRITFIALELISASAKSQIGGLSIIDVCNTVGLPGPGTSFVTTGPNQVCDLRETDAVLHDVTQIAAAMASGIYSWTIKKLEELEVVEKHRDLTNDKLRLVYMDLSSGNLPAMTVDQRSKLTGKPTLTVECVTTASGSSRQSTDAESETSSLAGSTVPDHGGISNSSEPVDLSSIEPIPPPSTGQVNAGTDPFADSLRVIYSRSTPSSSSSRSSALGARSVQANLSFGYPTGTSDQEIFGPLSAPQNECHSETVKLSEAPSHQSVPHGITPTFLRTSVPEKFANLPQSGTDDIHFLQGSEDHENREHGTFCLCTNGNTTMSVPKEESSNYDSNLSGLTKDLLRRYSERNQESIEQLLLLLGEDVANTLGDYLREHDNMFSLAEIVLDVGRRAEARFHKESKMDRQVVMSASMNPISSNDMRRITSNDCLTGFDEYNRCGIEGSLHSIRGLRNRKQKLIGLTIRICLPSPGCADMMYDIAQDGRSALIVGYSGVGKTTVLRELARCLGDKEKKRVLVVDTYNEIAGDYDTPHFSIGSARRQQVDSPENQHRTIKEGARNHCPEVVIIDLIYSAEDSGAVADLIDQGIQVFAGVNKDSVRSVCNHHKFTRIFQVTDVAGSDTGSLDSAGALTKYRPLFEALVEMKESRCWHVHDLSHSYNSIRRNKPYPVQERRCISVSNEGVPLQQILLRERIVDKKTTTIHPDEPKSLNWTAWWLPKAG